MAADHRDGPATALADPTVDITDVYAWMSADAARVYLVMDLQGANTGATAATRFSDGALYALHVTSGASLGMTAGEQLIVCKFGAEANQTFQCWAPGGEYVTDVVGNKAGKSSASGKVKVAALLREDPFPFNLRGFLGAAAAVKGGAAGLQFDPAGCPAVNAALSMALVNTLTSDGSGMPDTGVDDFGKGGKAPVASAQPTAVTNGNVMSIVLSIDKSLLTSGGSLLGVWGSTNKAK